MKKATSHNGFTLIELIIVMVILGILAAVAVPRYLDSISNAEASAEDAVISAIRSGLKQAANDSLYTNGRATWPSDPFTALSEKPAGHTWDGEEADTDGEWSYVRRNARNGQITHQRADNSRYSWDYYAGVQSGDNSETGTLGQRTVITVIAD